MLDFKISVLYKEKIIEDIESFFNNHYYNYQDITIIINDFFKFYIRKSFDKYFIIEPSYINSVNFYVLLNISKEELEKSCKELNIIFYHNILYAFISSIDIINYIIYLKKLLNIRSNLKEKIKNYCGKFCYLKDCNYCPLNKIEEL